MRFAAITAERIPKECLEKIRYAEPLSCQGILGVTGCPLVRCLARFLYKSLINRLATPYVFGRLLKTLQEPSCRNILFARRDDSGAIVQMFDPAWLLLIPFLLILAFSVWVLWHFSDELRQGRRRRIRSDTLHGHQVKIYEAPPEVLRLRRGRNQAA